MNPRLFKTDLEVKQMEEKENKVYSYKELKELNEVEKNDYIKKILEEDLQMNQYLLNVKDKIQKTEEQIEKVEITIDQSKENWDKEMQAINNRIFDIANQNGITKEQYYQNY